MDNQVVDKESCKKKIPLKNLNGTNNQNILDSEI